MPKGNYENIEKEISNLENKYFNLVWLARTKPEDVSIPGVKKKIEEVFDLFPDEAEALQSKKSGDWQHGFNSGMLAGMRFVLTAREAGIEEAKESFPELDS